MGGNAITMAFGTLAIQVLKVVPPGEATPGREISIAQGAGLLGRNRVANLASENRSGSVAPAFGNPS